MLIAYYWWCFISFSWCFSHFRLLLSFAIDWCFISLFRCFSPLFFWFSRYAFSIIYAPLSPPLDTIFSLRFFIDDAFIFAIISPPFHAIAIYCLFFAFSCHCRHFHYFHWFHFFAASCHPMRYFAAGWCCWCRHAMLARRLLPWCHARDVIFAADGDWLPLVSIFFRWCFLLLMAPCHAHAIDCFIYLLMLLTLRYYAAFAHYALHWLCCRHLITDVDAAFLLLPFSLIDTISADIFDFLHFLSLFFFADCIDAADYISFRCFFLRRWYALFSDYFPRFLRF